MRQSLTILALCVFAAVRLQAQDSVKAVPASREYSVTPISVSGEIENPGAVSLKDLPLRSVAVKEVWSDDSGKMHFNGAFTCTGHALYDILKNVTLKKANAQEFHPTTDVYIIVENDKHDRAVFSWGEIFSVRNRYGILVSSKVESIEPTKVRARWPLPEHSRLISAGDLTNERFIETPTSIRVLSFKGSFTREKDIYSPSVEVVQGKTQFTVVDIPQSVEHRTYSVVGFGHGTGYKGVETVQGYLLAQILRDRLKATRKDLAMGILVVSAKDSYRAVFSASEILNRNDNEEYLLIDHGESKSDGRYTLFAAPDFVVDRNVKAIQRIEFVDVR